MTASEDKLTSLHIDQYLEYIDIPHQFRHTQETEPNLAFLTALHTHHIAAFPYENLSLHYTKKVNISLDALALHRKFLQNGRGGYCMEASIFFNHILRALGFRAYLTGARIRLRKNGVPQGPYSGWRHIVNIIIFPDGSRYSCDVGFGGDGPTKPLPMVSGHIVSNLGSQEVRLLHDTLPGHLTESQKVWIYQYRNSTDKPWNSFYAFAENEWAPAEFDAINYWASTHPDSFQTYVVLIVRFLRTPGSDEIYGKVMLVDGEVKRNLGGKTSVALSCETEEERIKALKEIFNITLTDEEREGIRGRASELPAPTQRRNVCVERSQLCVSSFCS